MTTRTVRIAGLLAALLATQGCGSRPEGADAGRALAAAAPPPPPEVLEAGRQLYQQHCLVCHQAGGAGVPNMQPPLAENEVVQGDAARLVRLTLYGVGMGGRGVPASGNYQMPMPGVPNLSDEQVAALLTFLRASWGNDASPVTPEQARQARRG